MADPADVPANLHDLWSEFRVERALIRHLVIRECGKFWDQFPRKRRRVMPCAYFTDKPTWFEPVPVEGLGWEDHIGLSLRWRLSGTYVDTSAGNRKLKAMWEYDWPRDNPPTARMLHGAGIETPEALENYRYYWRMLHGWHEYYVWLGEWFSDLVMKESQRGTRLAMAQALGGGLDRLAVSADVKQKLLVDISGGRR